MKQIDIANHLNNWIMIKRNNKNIICKEKWTNKKQAISHFKIFKVIFLKYIFQKAIKVKYQKMWKIIFIE